MHVKKQRVQVKRLYQSLQTALHRKMGLIGNLERILLIITIGRVQNPREMRNALFFAISLENLKAFGVHGCQLV